MKKVFAILGMGICFSLSARAQDVNPAPEQPIMNQKQQYQETEDRKKLDMDEIPAEVMQGFKDTEYGQMTITEVYKIDGTEADRILKDMNQEEVIDEKGDQYKDERPVMNEEFSKDDMEKMDKQETSLDDASTLYELRVQDKNKMATLFFTQAGALLGVGEEVGIGK